MKNQFLSKSILFLTLSAILSGCSLGFLASKKQNITLVGDTISVIKIDGKSDTLKNNKFEVTKNGNIRQLEFVRPGYKSEYRVAYPYKMNWTGHATTGLNALGLAIPAFIWANGFVGAGAGASLAYAGVAGVIGAYGASFLTDISPKFREFDPKLNTPDDYVKKAVRDSLDKEIKLKKVAVDIKPENNEEYYLTYKDYKEENLGKYANKVIIITKGNHTYTKGSKKGGKNIKIDDTLFSDELNEMLKENGFIDTTGMVLKAGFAQNAYLNATILGSKSIQVNAIALPDDGNITGFVKLKLNIKWELLDYYSNVQLADTIESNSGEFVSYSEDTDSDYFKNALRDAIERGLFTFMQNEKYKTLTKLEESKETIITDTIHLNSPKMFAQSLEQAAQATLTIKNKSGHGSGFLISEDGYIITNYHVITDTNKLEVVLSDGGKYPAKIVRYNKDYDLALLKIEKNGLLPFSLKNLAAYGMGKDVYIIGTPSAEDLSQTLSKGIISSIRKAANGSKLIQTDASINGGSSGGPMINKDGQLIGVANAKLIGKGIEGIAFGIPAEEIFKALVIVVR